MKKGIFSISCTTCQTRLAVRAESAIGQILECPKCQSMVHVVPPPGWTPSSPPVAPSTADAAPHTPPPLDHVATNSAMLSLEPAESALSGSIFSGIGIAWAAASVATLAVVCALCVWLLRPNPDLADARTEPAAATVPSDAADKSPSPDADSADPVPPESPTATKPTPSPAAPASSPDSTLPTPDVNPPAKPNPPAPAAEPKKVDEKPAANAAAKDDKNDKEKEDVEPKPDKPEIKKAPPAEVDVAARMADPVRGLELTGIPLARALDLLATISTLPITLDPDALSQRRGTPHDEVSLKLAATTIEQALQSLAEQRNLAVIVDNGQVIVTTPADFREKLKTVPYTVSDLTDNDKTAVSDLIAIVQAFVAPESWQPAGGRGTVKPGQDGVVVTQTGAVHVQLYVFCEKLRQARHKPPRGSDTPKRFTLTTCTSQARKMLDKPVTVNFFQPTPLSKILAFLAETTGSDVLVDRAALAAADTSDRVETSLTVQQKPFAATLAELLAPLGLAYRVIGPNAIQVTTKESVDERMELEFYAIAPQSSKLPEPKDSPRPLGEGQGVRAAKLIAKLKAEVAPTTWGDKGGPAEIYFDAPSQCLIVLQSQPAQAAIEQFLATKRE